jgi:ArsR family transcriptional regulator
MSIDPKGLFAALAHDIRLRCLVLLMHHDELCACELTYAIGTPQPNISRHLAHLRELGLVSNRPEGLWIYYRIHPQLPEWVQAVLHQQIHLPFRDPHGEQLESFIQVRDDIRARLVPAGVEALRLNQVSVE